MNGIEIRQNPKGAEDHKKRPVSVLLFMAAGVVGILSFLVSAEAFNSPVWAVYSLAGGVCFLSWFTYYGPKKTFAWFAAGFVIVWGAALVLLWEPVGGQLQRIVDFIVIGKVSEKVSIAESSLLLAALVPFAVSLMEFKIKSHGWLSFLTMLAVMFSPMWGVRTSVLTMFLLAVFKLTFRVAQGVNLSNGKFMLGGVGKFTLSGKSSIAAALILVLIFLASFPLTLFFSEELYTGVYDVEGGLRRALLRSSGRSDEPVTGGKISNGNHYPTGTAQLELMASVRPSEVLYLRGFEGGEYLGGNWTRANDEELFAEIIEKKNWQDWSGTIGIRYSGMYYLMNDYMRGNDPPRSISLNIRHYGGTTGNIYVPYYSQRTHRYYYEKEDDVWYDYGYGNTREGYVYRYYEQSDMDIDWENVLSNFSLERDWFMEMQEIYMEEIKTAYTKVPVQLLPKLTGLCRENPLTELEEITTFILYTLQNNSSYTLTPGWAPLNEDIVDYFLFEGNRGFCEHYAVTATLMYRLYGIPARYATGYMVLPDAFEEQQEGGWRAIVTDESAHAWVEIFLRDYGWPPVGVPPAADGSSVAVYPGFDDLVFHRVAEANDWNQETIRDAQKPMSWQSSDGGNFTVKDNFLLDLKEALGKYEQWLYILLACVLYFLCLLPMILEYGRLCRFDRMKKAGCRRVFSRLLQMLRFGGILEGYDGTEEDFAEKLCRETAVSSEDVARMRDIVSQAAYGTRAPEPHEEDYVLKMYTCFAKRVYATLSWHRKLIFRYWKAFY